MRTATRRATVHGGRRAAADWWQVAGQTCVAAYKAVGALDLATSYVNLANPGTYDAAPGTAPTLGAAGWVFDGSTQYLTTGIVPANNQQWSILARIDLTLPNVVDYRSPIGCASNGPTYFGFEITSTYNRTYFSNGNYGSIAPAFGSGILCMAGLAFYVDGVLKGNLGTSAGTPSHELFIGAYNNLGTPIEFWLGTIATIAIYKPTEPSTTPMSAAEVASLTTRMAALT